MSMAPATRARIPPTHLKAETAGAFAVSEVGLSQLQIGLRAASVPAGCPHGLADQRLRLERAEEELQEAERLAIVEQDGR